MQDQALLFACQNGELNQVLEFLKQGVQPTAYAEPDRWSALMVAILERHTEIALLLIEHGHPINEKDAHGISVIEHALAVGDVKVFEALLKKGANIGACRDPLLLQAVHHKNSVFLSAVLQASTPPQPLLNEALKQTQDTGRQKMLMQAGAQVTATLFDALKHKDLPAFQSLLAHGADPNEVNVKKQTLLWLVCDMLDLEIGAQFLRGLLEAGANPNQSSKTRFGKEYPIEALVRFSLKDTSERLRQRLQLLDCLLLYTPKLTTVIYKEAHRCHPRVLERLLQAGANPNARKGAPLEMALRYKVGSNVQVLLEHGARIDGDYQPKMAAALRYDVKKPADACLAILHTFGWEDD